MKKRPASHEAGRFEISQRNQLDKLVGAAGFELCLLYTSQHAYHFGEGNRLARAALQLQLRLNPDEAAIRAWLDGLLQPLKQAQAWDEAALTDLHNLREFLWPLLAGVLDVADVTRRERLQLPLQKVLRQLP